MRIRSGQRFFPAGNRLVMVGSANDNLTSPVDPEQLAAAKAARDEAVREWARKQGLRD